MTAADMTAADMTDAERIETALARNPLFGAFGAETRSRIAACCTLRAFVAGSLLYAEGEPSQSAFLIVEGEAALDVTVAQGPITMGVFGQDEVVGERAMFDDAPRVEAARAVGEVVAVELSGADLREIIVYHPAVGLEMIRHLGRRLRAMTQPLAWLASAATAMVDDDHIDRVSAQLSALPAEIATVARAFETMARALKDQERKRDELATARRIQASILPPPWEGEPRLEIATFYVPAKSVGGDFFDYFKLGETHAVALIADVCGKGVPAALFMAVSRTILRSLLSPGDRPLDEAIAQANRMLATNNHEFMFVTCCVVILDLDDGRFSYANAGHNPPLIRRRDGVVEEVKGTGLPLAIDGGLPIGVAQGRLNEGETLVLYTDGVTEAHSPNLVDFGEPRLINLVSACDGSAQELLERIVAAVEAHADGAEQSDDITLAVVRRP